MSIGTGPRIHVRDLGIEQRPDEPKPIAARRYASETLGYYQHLVGDNHEEPETVLTDLLADLLHLADELDVDIDDLLDRSRVYHDEELVELEGYDELEA